MWTVKQNTTQFNNCHVCGTMIPRAFMCRREFLPSYFLTTNHLLLLLLDLKSEVLFFFFLIQSSFSVVTLQYCLSLVQWGVWSPMFLMSHLRASLLGSEKKKKTQMLSITSIYLYNFSLIIMNTFLNIRCFFFFLFSTRDHDYYHQNNNNDTKKYFLLTKQSKTFCFLSGSHWDLVHWSREML